MEKNPAASELSFWRKLLFIAAASLIFTVAVLAVLEIFTRWQGYQPWQKFELKLKVVPGGKLYAKDHVLGYRNIPGPFTITLADGYSFKATNLPDGHRITHPLDTYGAGSQKDEIWIFGCSMTYGWSLNDRETFPWLLQERLPQYEVVNFGVSGYSTVQSLLQFRQALEQGRAPRSVVLAFASWHDERNLFSRNWQRILFTNKKFGQLYYPYARLDRSGKLNFYLGEVGFTEFPLMKYSALMNFLEQRFDRLEERYLGIREVTEALLLEFINTAREHHIPVVIAGITYSKGTRNMLAFIRRHEAPAVDIAVDLDNLKNTNYPHDGHPGPRATRQYADKLENFLRGEVLPGRN